LAWGDSRRTRQSSNKKGITMPLKVTYEKPKLYSVAGVSLVPGINYIPDDKRDAFMEHPHTKIKIEKGHIRVIGEAVDFKKLAAEAGDDVDNPDTAEGESAPVDNNESGAVDATAPAPAKTKSITDLVADIKLIYDVGLLRELAEDKRVRVAKAAKARLEQIDQDTAVDSPAA